MYLCFHGKRLAGDEEDTDVGSQACKDLCDWTLEGPFEQLGGRNRLAGVSLAPLARGVVQNLLTILHVTCVVPHSAA